MRTVLLLILITFLLLFSLYFAVQAYPDYFGGEARAAVVHRNIQDVAPHLWAFARPLLQLAMILLILEAVTKRLGISSRSLDSFRIAWDIRALIAVFVVVAFCVAALGGSLAADTLKDVALVVIGFYFGGLGSPRAGESAAGQATVVKTPGQDGEGYEDTNPFGSGEGDIGSQEQLVSRSPKGTGESQEENEARSRRGLEASGVDSSPEPR